MATFGKQPDDRQGLFPSTRWSRVLAAQRDSRLAKEVFEELVRPRYKALYVLARQQLSPEDAEDAVQSFLAHLIGTAGEPAFVERLDPKRGSLRAYLKTAFRHHLSNLRAKQSSQKRGGGQLPAALEDVEEQLRDDSQSPDQLFDRAWASSLFADALAALKEEFETGQRQGPFELVQQAIGFGSSDSYQVLAERHDMSVVKLKAFIHRARLRFRTLLRDRVERTLDEQQDVDQEIRRLLQDLSA